MHDRIAELRGLRTELATCLTGPRPSRRAAADQVREQIARARNVLETEAEALEVRAEALAEAGQDQVAATAAAAARELRALLAEDEDQDEPAEAAPPAPEVPAGGTVFDPKEHSVPEIAAHLAGADEAELTRVLAAEAAGKARKSVLSAGGELLEAARARAAAGPKTTTAATPAPETRTGDA